MNFRIILKNKKWKNINDLYFLGDLDKSIAMQLSKLECKRIYPFLLKRGINHFAMIIKRQNSIKFYTDPVSSFPLLFSVQKELGLICVADNLNNIKLSKGKSDLIARRSLYNSGYTLGEDTVFKDIKWATPFSIIIIDKTGKIKKQTYFTKRKTKNINYKIIEKKIIDSISQLSGRQVVIPISAGYDSKFLAYCFKESNVSTSTFSYGPKKSWDVLGGKKAAKELGLLWRHIDLSRKQHRKFIRSQTFCEIERFVDLGVSSFYYQDVFPIQSILGSLKNKIVVNGNTGDFVTGGHLKKSDLNLHNSNDLVRCIYRKIYANWYSSFKIDESLRVYIEKEVKRVKKKYLCTSFLEILYFFELENRQAKYVIAGQRVYDFFNLDWRLPFWSLQFLDQHLIVNKKEITEQLSFKDFLINKNETKIFKARGSLKRFQHNLTFRILRKLYKILYLLNIQIFPRWEKSFFLPFLSTLHQMSAFSFLQLLLIPPVNKEPAVWSKVYLDKIEKKENQ